MGRGPPRPSCPPSAVSVTNRKKARSQPSLALAARRANDDAGLGRTLCVHE